MRRSVTSNKNQAFTLVELSIVLVILGLLVGGVLSGQSLIRAAELRTTTTEYTNFITAVGTFREKYFALPGDLATANEFWGFASTGTNCKTTASTDKRTCNGNGDNMINGLTASSNESYRFWQHLANAALITGSYDGITHGTNDFSSTEANSPASKVRGNYWFVWNWTAPITDGATANWFNGEYGNRLSTGALVVNGEPAGKAMKPEEAWNIDTKLDDAKPGRGKVRTMWKDCTQAANGTQVDVEYQLTESGRKCFMIFAEAF